MGGVEVQLKSFLTSALMEEKFNLMPRLLYVLGTTADPTEQEPVRGP
jgi:hypothetical protein